MNKPQRESETLTISRNSAVQSTSSLRYRIYVLIVLVLMHAMSWIDRTVFGVLAPLIKPDLNLTDTQLGLMGGTAVAIPYLLLGIPIGWLADRFNRVSIISAALTTWSVGTALCGAAGTAVHMLLARTIVGVGESGSGAAAQSLVVNYFPQHQRARALATYAVGMALGVGGAGFIGGPVADAVGWRMTFVLAGLVGLLLAFVMIVTVKEAPRVAHSEDPATPEPLLRSIFILLRKPGYLFVCLGASLSAVVGLAQAVWVPSYMVRSFDLSLVSVSVIYGLILFISGVFGTWVGGFICDYVGRKNPAAPALVPGCAFIAVALLFAGMYLAHDARWAWSFFFVGTFIECFGRGPMLAATQRFATPAVRATAFSLMNTSVITVGLGIGIPLIGLVSDLLIPAFGQEGLRYALLLVLPAICILSASSFLAAGHYMKVAAKNSG